MSSKMYAVVIFCIVILFFGVFYQNAFAWDTCAWCQKEIPDDWTYCFGEDGCGKLTSTKPCALCGRAMDRSIKSFQCEVCSSSMVEDPVEEIIEEGLTAMNPDPNIISFFCTRCKEWKLIHGDSKQIFCDDCEGFEDPIDSSLLCPRCSAGIYPEIGYCIVCGYDPSPDPEEDEPNFAEDFFNG